VLEMITFLSIALVAGSVVVFFIMAILSVIQHMDTSRLILNKAIALCGTITETSQVYTELCHPLVITSTQETELHW
jgi:hypothetical protein